MSSWARLTGGEDGPERGSFADAFKEIERRLSALERHRRGAISSDGTDTFLRSGDFIVTGGNIRVLDNGDIVINGGKLTAGPTEIDATSVRVGPSTLDATKLQVGTDVVLDADGLKIDGVLQPAFWPFSLNANVFDTSLTTTQTDKLTLNINPPPWVETLEVSASARLQMSNTSAGGQNLRCGVTTDAGGAHEGRTSGSVGTHPTNSPATNATTVIRARTIALSPAGRQVTVVMDASVNTGTNSSNALVLNVSGFGTRV